MIRIPYYNVNSQMLIMTKRRTPTMTQSKDFPPAIGALLRLAWQAVRGRIYEGVLEAGYTDLSRAHVFSLRWPPFDGLRPSEIATRTQLSRQAINDLLSDLEKGGYLERVPDPTDGRARIVRFTERGWDLTQVIRDMSFATEREWTRAIGEARFAEFRDTLRELVAYASPAGETVLRGQRD
jgi:DNA-binding MarR family transcriptional regulator